jgi:uncharacterized protein with FMN-binding domain
MKKYFLSTAVIASFLFYSFITRKDTGSPALSDAGTGPSQNRSDVPANPGVTPGINSGVFKNGTYTGDQADAFYGNIRVAAVIENGKLTKVNILEYPNDRNRSVEINSMALPNLQSEAIQAQSASVDIVTGATDTSQAFINSLGSALSRAKI